MPTPAYKATDENRKLVRSLAAVGTRHEDIATKLGISADTLTRHYRKELDDGRIDANASIAQTLFQQAKNGNTTAAIFWLKTRAGWKETDRHELVGDPDSPLRAITEIRLVPLSAAGPDSTS